LCPKRRPNTTRDTGPADPPGCANRGLPDSSVDDQIDERNNDDGRRAEDDELGAGAQLALEEHGDFIKEAVATVAAQLMEAEITAEIGTEERPSSA
jgi:hypothetical protein